jgi:hypothetical protein|uniref:Uncharacterized protein n=1 Tax=uncultured marine virus TaxID=186617 RepID=A0A0F7L3J8_9VIRU|nr:hypothetical protein [uncultured marine virus]
MQGINTVLLCDLDDLELSLSRIGNLNLIDSLDKNFNIIGDYQATDEFESMQIKEFSRIYVDEIRRRLSKAGISEATEFILLIKTKLKNDKSVVITFKMRTLLRLNTVAIKRLERLGITEEQLKREHK